MTIHHALWCSENRPPYQARVDKLAERIPTDPQVARDFLYAIVDRELAALRARRAELAPLYELNRSEAPARSAIDDTKQGELRRRYETANERELHKCIGDYVKVRKMRGQDAAGALDPGVSAPVTEPGESPEPDSEEDVASIHLDLSGSLRNEPEPSDNASLIRSSEPPISPDSRSGWGGFAS
jgi:hypothetical protein